MKVLIDAYQMAEEITGTDRFAANVLRHLQELDRENAYTVLCRPHSTYIPRIVTAPNFMIRYARHHARPRLTRVASRVGNLLRKVLLERPDLHFSFHNLSAPLLKSCPVVVSNLDVVPLVFPDLYYEGRGHRYRSWLRVKHAIRVADRFVSISEFSKAELVRRFAIDPAKVTVVYLGVDERFARVEESHVLAMLKKRYALPDRYVLTIGSTEPRKNVGAAIEAYRRLPGELRAAVGLVVIGRPWRGRAPASLVPPRQENGGGAGAIIFPGYVGDDDLPGLYSSAEVFLYPSVYEGFGLPPLEAMACGTPAICSNRTALPEVIGDGGILVDPGDPDAMATELARLLTDRSARETWAAKGRARAGQFSWRETARGILQVFRQFEK